MASGLILVDIQNEYFPGGRLELAGIRPASAHAGELLALFRDRGWPTFHIQHLAQQADAPLFTPGTSFVEIHESVRPQPSNWAIAAACGTARIPVRSFAPGPVQQLLRVIPINLLEHGAP